MVKSRRQSFSLRLPVLVLILLFVMVLAASSLWQPAKHELIASQPASSQASLQSDAQTNLQNISINAGKMVRAIAAELGGSGLAIATVDNRTGIWDAFTGNKLRNIDVLNGTYVRALSWSPDGAKLVVVFKANISILDTGTWVELALINSTAYGGGWFGKVSWSPDGSKFATYAGDRSIRIFMGNGSYLSKLYKPPVSQINDVAWSPDGTKIAVAHGGKLYNGTLFNAVRVWSASTGSLLSTLDHPYEEVLSVDWSPDGSELVTGTRNGSIRTWDVAGGFRRYLVMKGLTSGTVNSVRWSSDGLFIASASGAKMVGLWNSTLSLAYNVSQRYIPRGVAWLSPNKFVSYGDSSTVIVWSLPKAYKLSLMRSTPLKYSGDSVTWSPDSTRIAFYDGDASVIKIVKVSDGSIVRTIGGSIWRTLEWNPGGENISGGDHNNQARVWSVTSGATLTTKTLNGSAITSFSWSPDGKKLAIVSLSFASNKPVGNGIYVWRTSDWSLLKVIDSYNAVSLVAFSPDGTKIASTTPGEPRNISIWDASTFALIRKISGHTANVSSLAWSPDSKRLASGSADKTARVWDVSSGVEKKKLSVPSESFYSVVSVAVAWNAKNNVLAVGNWSGSITLYDTYTWSELQTLSGFRSELNYGSEVRELAFSPDGSMLASAQPYAGIKVWETA